MAKTNHGPQADAQVAPRARVMIVSDDHLAGRQLGRMLTAKGYEGVRAVSRAERALILAQKLGPGIIFLDVELSDDAYELARSLRRQAGQDSLRLIALTSTIEHSTREQARGAGFERWLLTPVAQNDLDNLLN